jgi:hypothetical protein
MGWLAPALYSSHQPRRSISPTALSAASDRAALPTALPTARPTAWSTALSHAGASALAMIGESAHPALAAREQFTGRLKAGRGEAGRREAGRRGAGRRGAGRGRGRGRGRELPHRARRRVLPRGRRASRGRPPRRLLLVSLFVSPAVRRSWTTSRVATGRSAYSVGPLRRPTPSAHSVGLRRSRQDAATAQHAQGVTQARHGTCRSKSSSDSLVHVRSTPCSGPSRAAVRSCARVPRNRPTRTVRRLNNRNSHGALSCRTIRANPSSVSACMRACARVRARACNALTG